ncbi:2'-deoxymugineic-acid 2'-dioxygenase, partial [Mucuna pruriens]
MKATYDRIEPITYSLVVTNSGIATTTVAYFIRPTNEQIVEPAKPFTSSGARSIYTSFTYQEFLRIYMSKG